MMQGRMQWDDGSSAIAQEVRGRSRQAVSSFKAQPGLLLEQYNLERSVVESGYRRAQLNELVQNAADAMIGLEGRLHIVLTGSTLYCANEGSPFRTEGVTSIMMAHNSVKRGKEVGRYGLGFKSVLEISDRPEIISRSASFRWSEDITRHALEEVDAVHRHGNLPILRIAEVFDPVTEAKVDPALAELMEWADTIVRLPLVDGGAEHVSNAADAFRGEFVLFSDSVGRLEIEDRVKDRQRAWTAEHIDDTTIDLRTDERRSQKAAEQTVERWRVFTDEHRPSPQAAAAAGTRNSRDQLLVHWAVPVHASPQRRLGEIWSHFPTESTLSLRGIVNAPFQTADDRHDIIRGPYNEEVLTKSLARIVAGALPQLASTSAPSRHLAWLPSRDRETSSWADSVSNDAIVRTVSHTPCLPDLAGGLRFPGDLLVPPTLEQAKDVELRDARDYWYTLAHEETAPLANWLHESALQNDGAGTPVRVRRILEFAGVQPQEPIALLEALARTRSLTGYRNALRFAVQVQRSYVGWQQDVYRAAFIPTAEGRLEPPLGARVMLPDPSDSEPTGPVVIPDVARDPESLDLLKTLGITGQDDEGRLRRAVGQARTLRSAQAFESMWDTLHQLRDRPGADDVLRRAFDDPGQVLVRRLDGSWQPVSDTWRIGDVFVPAFRESDAALLLDHQYHQSDLMLLSQWGLRQSLPDPTGLLHDKAYARTWEEIMQREALEAAHGEGYRISRGDVRIDDNVLTPGLLDLRHASASARKRIVDILADRLHSSVSLQVRANYRTWSTKVLSPDAWWVRAFGYAMTPLGLLAVEHCSTGEGVDPSFPRELLPIPSDIGPFADAVLPSAPTADAWAHILGTAVDSMRDQGRVYTLYAHAAAHGAKRPARLRARDRHHSRFVDAEHCVVTFRDEVTHHLVTHRDVGVIQVGDEHLARTLEDAWSLEVEDMRFTRTVPDDSYDEPVNLVDLHEHIGAVDPKLKRLRVALADQVVLRTTNDADDVVDEDTTERVRVVPERALMVVDRALESRVLHYALRVVGSMKTPDEARRIMAEDAKQARLKAAAEKQNEWEKLFAYFGSDSFDAVVPGAVRAMVEEYLGSELDAEQLFSVAKAMYGADVLRKLSSALRADGDASGPSRFSGSRQATAFVRQLGIDPAYAGERYVRLPAQEVVTGPVKLNPLHDFQRDVSRQVRQILTGEDERRAMVQLPTGAGKTRVAVESVVRHIAESAVPLKGHVLWIAQTKELCEQAVSTWMAVWRAHGSENVDMVVSRFWDGNPRDSVTGEAGLHVVASTPQTADKIFASTAGKDAWFQKPGLVIVDEAHGAEATTTRTMLSRFKRSGPARTPVVGLSATPYRGTDERRTQSLVDLFDGNLLAPEQFQLGDATAYLQGHGYLSDVDHYTLQGMALPRTSNPDRDDEEFVLGRMDEALLDLDAVARSTERNNEIIQSVLARGADQRTLLFAASVEHARALAAVFSYENVPSIAVDAEMSPGARRGAVEMFRKGDLKVLTNFNVLSQGFDVPDVTAVYVCRPTFVPNRYLQMIGRGLRGPENGGTKRVDIVNVQDNADNFGTKLAFTHFDHLWTKAS